MVLYLSIWFFIFFFALLEILKVQVSNKITFFIVALVLLLFAGFRYGIETDYWTYYKIFKYNITRVEPGFAYLMDLFRKRFSLSFNWFVFFIASLSISIKFFSFRKIGLSFFALFIYYSLYYINFEYNIIRQGLAASFLLIASNYIEKKDWKKYLLFVAIASSMHLSSLLFLPVYFIALKPIKIKSVVGIIFLLAIIRIFLFSAMTTLMLDVLEANSGSVLYRYIGKAMRYLEMDMKSSIDIGFIRRFVIIILFVLINGRLKINNIYFNIYLYGYMFYILFMGNAVLSNRASASFEFFIVPMFASALKGKYISYKTIHIYAVLAVIMLMLFITTLLNGNAVPYQTFLNRI